MIGRGIVQSGDGRDLATLDRHHEGAGDGTDEGRGERTRSGIDRPHEPLHPLDGVLHVLPVDLPRRLEGLDIGVERGLRRTELGGDGLEIGADGTRPLMAVQRVLDPRGRTAEEGPYRGDDDLLLAGGDRIEGALGASEPGGQVGELKMAEALGQIHLDQLIDEGIASVRPARTRRVDDHLRYSTEEGYSVLLRVSKGAAMPVDRLLPTSEASDLIDLTRQLVDRELRPIVDQHERDGVFPREVFRTLGRAGLLGLPYPERYGGGGQPYEVYLQVLEEIGTAWASVGVGTSVHALSCFGLFTAGSDAQRERWLPDMLGGELLGAYCLSEAHAGSDPSAMRTRARREGDEYVIDGAKAWTTHGGQADFYKVMATTDAGITCFLVPADAEGLSADHPEDKMGLMGSTTATMLFDGVRVPAERRLGDEGQGLSIALAGLDAGRLGIAAVATGVAQGALDVAVAYAKERETFGQPIIDHQGLTFLLADMAAAVESARATYLAAARRRDAGISFGKQASIAKLVATDNAMKVTTDAVQVLGGAGYTRDFPVERYMRETKVMQIFEGTNQIQRLVIGRGLKKQ